MLSGRPTKIGGLLDTAFQNWLKNDLVTEINSESSCGFPFRAVDVSDDDQWYNPIINDTVDYLRDNPAYVNDDLLHLYIGFEQSFDCIETNCALHSSWSLHVKRIDSDDETIQEYYDTGHLVDEVESWIRSFLELRFPSISFDYDSLINGDSLPYIRL